MFALDPYFFKYFIYWHIRLANYFTVKLNLITDYSALVTTLQKFLG